jgi:branched-chain amino acid transport system permease protein
MEYVIHILILIAIYAILAISLDLVVGQMGLLSVAHAVFFGVGAYASAILSTRFAIPFALSVLIGMWLAAVLSLLVSLPTVRVHEDYFVIVSFGIQLIAFAVLNNWVALTRGPLGLAGIPQPIVFGWQVRSDLDFLALSIAFMTFAQLIIIRIAKSPFGRIMRAIREDELFAQAYGKNTYGVKIAAFAISASFAASAGSLYAHYIAFIDPTSFTIMDSIMIVSMVILGGAGSQWGPVTGAAILVALPEALRFIGFTSATTANLRLVLYGVLLVVLMKLRPRGLMGGYGFGR